MKAEEYLQARKVSGAGRSKLAPAWPDIQKLREAGCSLYEIQTFLKENSIETSVPNLAAFIKRQEAKKQSATDKTGATRNLPTGGTENPSAGIDTQSPTVTHDDGEPNLQTLPELKKSSGAKFDELDKQSGFSDRFNKPKGTK